MEKILALIALLGLFIAASSCRRPYVFLPKYTTTHSGGTTTHYSSEPVFYTNRARMRLGIFITLVGAVPLGIMKLIS